MNTDQLQSLAIVLLALGVGILWVSRR